VSTRRQRRDRRHARDRLLSTLGANLACGYGVHDSIPDPDHPGYTVCTRCGAIYPERPPVSDLSPTNAAEYALRFFRNQQQSGYGIEGVTMHFPCPWCAARDFQVVRVIDAHEAMTVPMTCAECGRSGRWAHIVDEPGRTVTEFVQTGGDDAPDWLVPAPRREDR